MMIKVQRVHYMPKKLMQGVLYVSQEYGAAAHLCACGCGTKVRTPLGPTTWSLEETDRGPTLRPSIGNWQLPCKSHYWISQGEIVWAEMWSSDQITAGRNAEEKRRDAYYDTLTGKPLGFLQRAFHWFLNLFR